MSTRIGIKLEDDLYEAYKTMLFIQKKTIQEDLEHRIKEAVGEYQKKNVHNAQ